MIPKSLSATAIQVAEACPARFKAENLERSKGMGGVAANTGSTVHGALEMFIKGIYFDKTHSYNWNYLVECLKLSYVQVFGSYDTGTPEYEDAYEMLDRWYKRNDDLHEIHRIISVEVKEHFLLPTSAGNIQFNYIWDRFDEIKPGVFKVVDYKSNRWGLTPDQLGNKIQARVYALAAAIKLKSEGVDYKRIWVEFDLLRHTPVGRAFTRDDNARTWRFLIDTAEDIIRRKEDEFEERLNPECLFCVRKVECKELAKNIMVGGIHSLSLEQKADVLAKVNWQASALAAVQKELQKQIEAECKVLDIESFETDQVTAEFFVGKTRKIDAEMAEKAIGPKLFERYGSKKLNIGDVDKLLKGKELTDEQKRNLRSLIYEERKNPSLKLQPKNPIDED